MPLLIQGSAARQTKKAMLLCWQEGIVPLIQMHDELGSSVTSEKQGQRKSEIMREAIKLTVPMRTDCEYGTSWGTARKIETRDKKVLYDASWESAVRLRETGKWW
jgi:DNA polymerase I-like protein with 3'-5' exonuclease and polymerase domains